MSTPNLTLTTRRTMTGCDLVFETGDVQEGTRHDGVTACFRIRMARLDVLPPAIL